MSRKGPTRDRRVRMPLQVGLRLALGGVRSTWGRLALMVSGVAVAVALLLGVAGAGPAALARVDTANARGPASPQPALTEGIRALTSVGFWRGEQLRVVDVEVVGSAPVAPPPGLDRLPAPGEVAVSPALAAALAGPRAAELAPRLHGRVVTTISDAGLVGPDELFAISGAPAGQLTGELTGGFGSQSAFSVRGDGTVIVDRGVGDYLLAALIVAAIALVVPLLVFVATATRLSAATRERRAAALRLLGATARQVSGLGGIEGLAVGLLGTLAGLLLFLGLRGPLAAVLPVPTGVFAAEISPAPWSWVLILVGVPVLAAGAGWFALRRSVGSPLDVRRQAVAPVPSLTRLVPVGVGLALLAAAAVVSRTVSASWLVVLLLAGGALLCLIGLASAGPALARATGSLLARFGPGAASQLAGRRLVMDPASASRTITGTALVVVVVGWLVAVLPLLATTNPSGQGLLAADVRPDTVVVGFGRDTDPTNALDQLQNIDGVGPVVPIRQVQLTSPGASTPDRALEAVIVDCVSLSALLREPLDACSAGATFHVQDPFLDGPAPQPGQYQVLGGDAQPLPGTTLTLPTTMATLTLPDGLMQGVDGFSTFADVLIADPSALPGPADEVLIGTNGDPATIEGVRAALGQVRTPFAPLTAEEATTLSRSVFDGYTQLATIGLTLVVLAGGMSLAVTTSDGLRERRAAHAALSAMGAPIRTLRRAVLLQTTAPLVITVLVALVVSATAAWLYLRIGTSAAELIPALPWARYGFIGAAAVAAGVLATAASLPFIRSAVHPEALRTE